jgi:hypothetical protein
MPVFAYKSDRVSRDEEQQGSGDWALIIFFSLTIFPHARWGDGRGLCCSGHGEGPLETMALGRSKWESVGWKKREAAEVSRIRVFLDYLDLIKWLGTRR